MNVASVVSGVFFKEKIDAAIKRTNSQHTFCGTIAEVRLANPHIVLVDLEHPEAHMVLREYGAKAIAFGPHMRQELLAVAREFGAQAYPRSVFFSQLDKLLHLHE